MFKELFTQPQQDLNEVLITLGKKAYPRFGHIVILAGGAASGKGFVKQKLLGIEGKSLDVDQLKELSQKVPSLIKRAKEEFNMDLQNIDMKDVKDVSDLHNMINKIGLSNRRMQALYGSILAGDPKKKPNIIFDVTLKSISKLESIVKDASRLGYKPENIHIVWVVNDIKVALMQNTTRDRKVKPDILVSTHEGASITMNKIINMGTDIKKYMNGTLVLAFNKRGVDTSIIKSENGGEYIIDSNYIIVKEQGKSVDTNKINSTILNKIRQYVPKSVSW